jgi:hypothetical protein
MPGGISSIDTMVSVWIIEGLKLLIRPDQGINQVNCVLEMNIIITRTMNQ